MSGEDDITVEKTWDLNIKSMANKFDEVSTNNDTGTVTPSKSIASYNSISSKFNKLNADIEVCCVCEKKVYPLEKIMADKKIYHKSCFRCTKCQRILNVGDFSVNEAKLFCKPHFMELFKIRGRYDEKKYVVGNGQTTTNSSNVQENNGNHRNGGSPASSPERYQHQGEEGSESAIKQHELPPEGLSRSIADKFREMERLNGNNNNFSRTSPCHHPVKKLSSPFVDGSEAMFVDVVREGPLVLEEELPPKDTAKAMAQRFRVMESCEGAANPPKLALKEEKETTVKKSSPSPSLSDNEKEDDDLILTDDLSETSSVAD